MTCVVGRCTRVACHARAYCSNGVRPPAGSTHVPCASSPRIVLSQNSASLFFANVLERSLPSTPRYRARQTVLPLRLRRSMCATTRLLREPQHRPWLRQPSCSSVPVLVEPPLNVARPVTHVPPDADAGRS